MTASTPLRLPRFILVAAILLLPALFPGQTNASAGPSARPLPGCTTFYGYDGQNALAGNNEDFINPLMYAWFLELASTGTPPGPRARLTPPSTCPP